MGIGYKPAIAWLHRGSSIKSEEEQFSSESKEERATNGKLKMSTGQSTHDDPELSRQVSEGVGNFFEGFLSFS